MVSHKGTQTLETERLILRKYRLDDADDMFANWVTDRDVTRFWGWKPHDSIHETRELLQSWIYDYQRDDVYHWVIEYKENTQAIGYIYLNEFENEECHASVHYLLSKKYWNKGFMSEACARVLGFAFGEIGLSKVFSRHHELNPASGRVLGKCGFCKIGNENKEYVDSPELNGLYMLYEVTKIALP